MARVGVLVFVLVLVWRSEANTKTRFLKIDASRGVGSVLLSKTVSTSLECAALCTQLSGVGYNMGQAPLNPDSCTVLGTQTSIQTDGNSTLFCGTCKILGDSCSLTADCTIIEPVAVCSAGKCACPQGYSTQGVHCVAVPAAFGASCFVDAQCLATTNYTRCGVFPNVCVCAVNFKVNTTGNGCTFDYIGFGFSNYNGRLVKVFPGSTFGLTWDGAEAYCSSIFSRIFHPLNSADWNWMDSTARGQGWIYLAFPINDKAAEGVIVWNNGTLVGNDGLLQWNFNTPAVTNNFLTNCVGMSFIIFVPSTISFGICGLINLFSGVICEAKP